jgi:hypothetical protein
MATQVQFRRGTTTQNDSFTGAAGELSVNSDIDALRIHDGSTQGGFEIPKNNLENTKNVGVLTATSFVGPVTGNADTATTLATSRTLSVSGDGTGSASFNGSGDADIALTLANSGVSAATYGSSSAIPILTVDSKGLVTSASTTAIDSTTVSNGTASVAVASNGPITSTGNHDFTAGIDVTGDITVTGTVDGRDVATDGSKLDGIEASADVTDATNVNAAGAVMNSDTSTGSMSFVVDEDNMSSNSATKVPTQQSVKTYVDTEVAGVIDSAPGALNTLNELAAALGDDASFSTTVTNSIATKLPLAGGQLTGNITFSGSQTVDGRDLSVDGAKLDGIASGATNVTNNNQLTNGAGYVTSNTQLSDEQVQDIVGGMVTGNTESGITVTYQDGDGTIDFSVASQTDQNFTTTLKNKLDGIESNATADQTAAEIRTLVESATDSNVFTDADHSKLNGIASGATNVTNNNQLTNGAGFITSVAFNSLTSKTSGTGNYTTTGDFTAANFNSTSDINLKENIEVITSATEMLNQIRGVKFTWKETEEPSVGVIAQDVEKVLPELISERDDETKTVNYNGLIGVLIEAVKEQQKQIDDLKGEVNKLKGNA